MKLFTSLLLGIVSFGASALSAAPSAPLLVKEMRSGHTIPAYAYNITCEIHQKQVVIRSKLGRDHVVGFSETRRIDLDRDIVDVITAAAQETTSEQEAPCDLPSENIRAHFPGSAHAEPVVLQASGGCREPRIERKGPASIALKRLVNSLCPGVPQ